MAIMRLWKLYVIIVVHDNSHRYNQNITSNHRQPEYLQVITSEASFERWWFIFFISKIELIAAKVRILINYFKMEYNKQQKYKRDINFPVYLHYTQVN